MRKTKAEAEKTRQTLLTSALKLFAQNSYSATGLAHIAKDCGLTRGAIYWHFENKADILAALEALYFKPFIAQMDKALDSDNAWAESERQLIDIFSHIRTKGIYIMQLFENHPKNNAQDEVSKLIDTYEKIRRKQIYQLIDKARKNKEIPANIDRHLAFLQIRNTMRGIVGLYTNPIEGINTQHYAALMIRQTFKQIQRPLA